MNTHFKDHFSAQSADYMVFRPSYPASLFQYLAGLPERRQCAWDCGTGNGQAALGLAPHFERVQACDASANQIEHATPHDKATYFVATAENSGLPEKSVDLVLVAQAAHWLDFDKFYAEVRRVAAPGAVVALVGYGYCVVEGAVDALAQAYAFETLAGFWPPERAHIDNHYRDLPFPFPERTPPDLAIETEWDADHFLGYLGTWSSTQRFRREKNTDPLEGLAPKMNAAWGDGRRRVRWPLFMRVGSLSDR